MLVKIDLIKFDFLNTRSTATILIKNVATFQIKQMLIRQQSAIIESLRLTAKLKLKQQQQQQQQQQQLTCTRCSRQPDVASDSCSTESGDSSVQTDLFAPVRSSSTARFGRLCPMCEAVFPDSVGFEDFESHVIDHFNFEESGTLVGF